MTPQGWEKATLGDVVRPGRKKVAPRSFTDLPFVGLEHVRSGALVIHGSAPAPTMRSQAVRFCERDVLYGRLRPYLNKVVCPDFAGLCSAEFIVLPAPRGVAPKFIQYRMHSSDFVAFASDQDEGDRPRVDFDQLSAFEFALPPSSEQDRIVAAIEQQLSRVEAGVEALTRVKRELARYRASVLKAACAGRLVPTEAALAREEHRDYEPARALLARILAERSARWDRKKKYAEPAPPDTTSLPALPEGWVWASLAQLAELKGGITKGQKRKASEAVRQVPYLRVANVQRGWLDLREIKMIEATEAEILDLRLRRGDVLFNEGGDRDKLGRGWIWEEQLLECIHQNHVFRARLSEGVHPKFTSWHGNTFGKAWFEEHGKQTTNLASINLTKLGLLPVPLPPLAEQHRIVAEVERRLSIADGVALAVDAALACAARLRQSILKRAFEGKLVPQDPSDEPASVLLARIRAEREQEQGAKPKKKRARA